MDTVATRQARRPFVFGLSLATVPPHVHQERVPPPSRRRHGAPRLERASLAIRPKAQTVVPAVAKTVMTEPIGPSQEERIHAALVGMGFTAGCVRKFMASVRGRQAPLETLVKEGIVALSATN